MRNLTVSPTYWKSKSEPSFVDLTALEKGLRSGIRGEVRFGSGDRAMYASDAGNYRMVPIGVILPKNADDVMYGLEVCRRYHAPVVGRGGGTGIPGQTVNTAVVFDFSKYMNHIHELNPGERWATVEPGIIPDQLRHEAIRFGLTFGPDPATHNRNTIGGMIANNSCGIHSVMAGETVDNVHELDVVTYDGLRLTVGPTPDVLFQQMMNKGGRTAEIYRRLRDLRDRYAQRIRTEFRMIPRRVSGYNLPALLPEQGFDVARALVGTEGTLVFVLEATAHLVRHFPERVLVLLGYPDIFHAGDA